MNGKMTAAVLYGKEDVKIEQSAHPARGRRRSSGQGAGGADLRHRSEGLPARLSRPHDRAAGAVRPRTGRSDRGSRARRARLQEGHARGGAEFGALRMCFYCSKHQENLCEDLLFNNGAYAEYIRIPRRIVETNMLAVPANVTLRRSGHGRAAGLRPARPARDRSRNRRYRRGHRRRPHRPDVRAGRQGHRLQCDRGGQARFAGRRRQAHGRARSRADHQGEGSGRGRARAYSRNAAAPMWSSKPSAVPKPGSGPSTWCARAAP